jgi:hypothetical protein
MFSKDFVLEKIIANPSLDFLNSWQLEAARLVWSLPVCEENVLVMNSGKNVPVKLPFYMILLVCKFLSFQRSKYCNSLFDLEVLNSKKKLSLETLNIWDCLTLNEIHVLKNIISLFNKSFLGTLKKAFQTWIHKAKWI